MIVRRVHDSTSGRILRTVGLGPTKHRRTQQRVCPNICFCGTPVRVVHHPRGLGDRFQAQLIFIHTGRPKRRRQPLPVHESPCVVTTSSHGAYHSCTALQTRPVTWGLDQSEPSLAERG